jgi:hypothetical protein
VRVGRVGVVISTSVAATASAEGIASSPIIRSPHLTSPRRISAKRGSVKKRELILVQRVLIDVAILYCIVVIIVEEPGKSWKILEILEHFGRNLGYRFLISFDPPSLWTPFSFQFFLYGMPQKSEIKNYYLDVGRRWRMNY